MSDWSPVKPVTPEVKNYCIQLKPQTESMAGTNFATFSPLDFISKDEGQVNYLYVVKVDVGADNCAHVKITVTGGGDVILEGVQYAKHLSDPLLPF